MGVFCCDEGNGDFVGIVCVDFHMYSMYLNQWILKIIDPYMRLSLAISVNRNIQHN